MQKIKGKQIILTKGDTFKAQVSMKLPNGRAYTPEAGDVIRFAMKNKYTDVNVLLQKVIPNETLILQFDPSDTKNLAATGYVYDIQITFANGDVDTFISGTLVLGEEVD